MTITSLSQAVRDPERVNVSIDGKFALGIDKQTLAEFRLFQGMEITSSLLNQLEQSDQINYLYRRMLDWWGKRPRSSREAEQKLKMLIKRRRVRKAGSNHGSTELTMTTSGDLDQMDHVEQIDQGDRMDQVVNSVLSRLQNQGYDDASFADWFARSRADQGKYGKRKVAAELASKGVERNIVSAVIDRYFENETELARKLLMKKFGVESLKEIKDIKEKSRAWRWLASRGISIKS